jgi:hypothetical protein
MHPACVSLKKLLILDHDPGPLALTVGFLSTVIVYSMHATHATPIDSPFDKLSFVKYVKDIGREYRQQAVKLVSICRTFAQAQKQTRSSYDEFRRCYSQIMSILGSV